MRPFESEPRFSGSPDTTASGTEFASWLPLVMVLLLAIPTGLDGQSLQPRMGDPIDGLTPSQLTRFDAGREEFLRTFTVETGLGPGFNQDSCASCHALPVGGGGSITVTRFGTADKGEPFDPLAGQGGSLLQANAISDECLETVPVNATVVIERITPSILGAGLIEAIPDEDIIAGADPECVAKLLKLHIKSSKVPIDHSFMVHWGHWSLWLQYFYIKTICQA